MLQHPCCYLSLSLPGQVFAIKDEIEDKQLQYPEYYTRAFHGAHAVVCALPCCCMFRAVRRQAALHFTAHDGGACWHAQGRGCKAGQPQPPC